MAGKDLLKRMIELRKRNWTYKQIADELEVSPSLVGKMLKEVRDNPELSLEFIKLTDFETGQTVLSFTPEDFEKYRSSSTLYYLGLRVFDIRDGLIHSTDFETRVCGGSVNLRIPDWYGEIIKLYGTDWSRNILTKLKVPRITPWKNNFNSNTIINCQIIKDALITEKDEKWYTDSINHNSWIKISDMFHHIAKMNVERLSSTRESIKHSPSNHHWFENENLVASTENILDAIRNYNAVETDHISKIEYLLPLIDGTFQLGNLATLVDAMNEGWNISDFGGRDRRNFFSWQKCFKESISLKQWDEMNSFGITDFDYYKEILEWISTNWQTVQSIRLAEVGEEYAEGTWQECSKTPELLDEVIIRLQAKGWTPLMINSINHLGNQLSIPDVDLIKEIGTEMIKIATASIDYCKTYSLVIDSGNYEWFRSNKWKIPKLSKGFSSYAEKEIYDIIKKEKSNFLYLNNIREYYDNSPKPRRDLRFKYIVQNVLNRGPFEEICSTTKISGRDLIVIKPVNHEILHLLHNSGVGLEELQQLDVTKASEVHSYFSDNDIEFTSEVISWAISKEWDIPKLGVFNSYKELRLYERLQEFEIPAVRLDKMLVEFNQFQEPGALVNSELDMHQLLSAEPFNKICKSSDDGGMIFFNTTQAKNFKPIIQEKIVIKEVVVKEEVIVQADSFVEEITDPLVDLSPYEKIRSYDYDYAKRVVQHINSGDLLESINSVWRLLRIEADNYLGDTNSKQENFNVKLVDQLAQQLNLDERTLKKLHQLRRARNDFDKGKSESPIKPTKALIIAGLEIIENLISKK
ncbi:MAG: hypothetical protein ACJZ6A_08475 [Candidatus Poseidoniaceae archaeon]